MIVAVSGVTGVGKSYLKRCIAEELGIKNILMVTTRKKRFFDKNGKDKWFVSEKHFEKMKKNNQLTLTIEFLKNKYGYYTNEIMGEKDGITEIYFTEVDNFKQKCKDLLAIYIKPTDIEISKKKLRKRKLSEDVIEDRIKEMEKQIEIFDNDRELQLKYDYIFLNDYTNKSRKELIEYIKNKIENRKLIERG